jgi:hypothetical protein
MSVLGPDPSGSTSWRPFVVGVAAGATIIGVVWVAVLLNRHDPASASAAPAGHHAHHAAAVASSSAAPARTSPATNGCPDLVKAQAPALRAAAKSLAQWKVHVDAMNQLVAGRITLAQATDFWNHTRVGAKRLIGHYQAVRQQLRADAPPCDSGARCAAAAQAREQELRIADRALATWNHHVHDMEMLRMGMMTPTQATQMWVRNWHIGVRQLGAYHAAADLARGVHCG